MKTHPALHRTAVATAMLAILTGLVSVARTAEPAGKANVLFIIVDDLNTALGCYGNRVVKTPNIDRLAAQGVRFDRAYCQFPLCNPSRSSLLTGRRPETTKIFGNAKGPRTFLGDVVMLPEYFRSNGYFTGRVGKVADDRYEDAIRWDVSENPFNRDGKDMYPVAYRGERTFGGTRNFYIKLTWEATDRDDEDEPDGCTARRIIELLEANRDRSFFIAAGFYKPHLPFDAPRKYFDMYPPDKIVLPQQADQPDPPPIALTLAPEDKAMTDAQRREAIAAYYACTTFMDVQLGKVLDALDRLQLSDRTVVVLVGDHGFHLGEHGGLWRKMTLFEESTRVPLIVRAPGKNSGAVSPRLVELVDLYPSLAELAGLAAPDGVEGTSFVPLLSDPARAWKKAAFSMVARFETTPDKPSFGKSVCTERFRFNDWGDDRGLELYDLESDPLEHHNLAESPDHAATVVELRRILDAGWQQALPDPAH